MLKQIIPAALLVIFSLSSCIQAYDCECVTTENGKVTFTATDTYTGTRKSTQRICDKFEEDVNGVSKGGGSVTECTLK